jgi:thiamine pyrophosphokinase
LRVVIFANGGLAQPVRVRQDDLIIAADGGALHCLKLGLRPAYVIGDLDSLTPEAIDQLETMGAQIIEFPKRKDFTDLELALQHARSFQPEDVLIYGALGARWDQSAANLLLPAAYPELPIRLVDGQQEIFYIRAGASHSIEGSPGDTVSLVPLGGAAQGITTHNLEYPLDDELLLFGSTRGVSNTLIESPAVVSLKMGLLLCIIIHH